MLKAPLRVFSLSFPIVSLSLFSSLCMQPHFPLGWNAPNRSFFYASALSRRYGSWLEFVRLHSANRPRFVSNLSCAAEASDIGETGMWSERGSQKLERSIGINLRSSVFQIYFRYFICLDTLRCFYWIVTFIVKNNKYKILIYNLRKIIWFSLKVSHSILIYFTHFNILVDKILNFYLPICSSELILWCW